MNAPCCPYFNVDFVNAILVPDDSLVWGSLRLAPNTLHVTHISRGQFYDVCE